MCVCLFLFESCGDGDTLGMVGGGVCVDDGLKCSKDRVEGWRCRICSG